MKKKRLSAIVLLSFLSAAFVQTKTEHTKEKIKLYSFYTLSHKQLKDEWFLPSIKDDYEIIIAQYEQECPSGEYRSKGWIKTMLHKVDLILDAIDQNWEKIFIYSDIDIQFFKPTEKIIVKLMYDRDILFQTESPTGDIGAGFMVLQGNERTRELWQTIRKFMLNHPGKTDQLSLNFLLRKTKQLGQLKWGYLPVEFFAGGTLTGKVWHQGQPLALPKNVILHHANSTIGMQNKLAQLRYVRSKVKIS